MSRTDMLQPAVIEQVRPGAVRIRVAGCNACENCNCNALLRWTRSRPYSFWMRVSADANWRAQQSVQLMVASRRMLAATGLLYGAPLAGWLAGAALGSIWGDLATLALSVFGMAIALALATRLARRYSYINVSLLPQEQTPV